MSVLIAGIETRKIDVHELSLIEAPAPTDTHQPIKHADFALEVETGLAMRNIQVIKQEFAVSPDGMKMFGLMVTNQQFHGCNYAIGLRNSNDKSMKIGMVAGYRVVVCENLAFSGEFTPLMAKHTSKFSMQDAVAIGIDRVHRGLNSVVSQVERLKDFDVPDNKARDIIYDAFVPKSGLRLPKAIMNTVHEQYFEPSIDEFTPRTAFSLSNAFTEGFKQLKPVRQFQETGKFTPFFLESLGLAP